MDLAVPNEKRMDPCEKLLLSNKAWVKERVKIRPDFFERHAEGQSPQFLWIGCSDSRVPAEEITGAGPGELFVHRNIANIVAPADTNFMAVLQYSIEVLKVGHIIVCGHYNCGGVRHAMKHPGSDVISRWLEGLHDIYRRDGEHIEAIHGLQARWDHLVEINVTEQLRNLVKCAAFLGAPRSSHPVLHGWVYDIRTGYLRELAKVHPATGVEEELEMRLR